MVSVIVPVYNAEDYLKEAILSVFSQTYEDWELILVDDGSTDSSPKICDKAAIDCNKVRVAHIENGGVSHARNVGIEMARGEYITFLDADDILSPLALKIFVKVASQYNADIVGCNVREFVDKEYQSFNIKDDYIDSISLSSLQAASLSLYQKVIDNSICGKLYSITLFKTLRFNEKLRYEDLDLSYRLFLQSSSVAVIRQPLYFYRQHKDSYIHTFNIKRADVLNVAAHIVEFASSHCKDILPAARSRQLSANFNILGLIAANGFTDDAEASAITNECWKKIKELRLESLRNPNVRLKNKIGIVVSYMFGRKGVETLSKLVYK